MAKIGMTPLPEEVVHANPKLVNYFFLFFNKTKFTFLQNQSEDLFINANNTSERTTLQIYFTRRPVTSAFSAKFETLKDAVSVSFKLHDGQGNVYSLEEQSVVAFSATEYRGSGFAYEALEGNRTGRIKFRGYLKRNEEEKLVYVQVRFLTLAFSKTFDHQRLFDSKWMAKELYNTAIGEIEDILEDKIEQFAHIKGTFKVEEEEKVELHFIGSIGRRFSTNSAVLPRRVIKISGNSREGFGFQVGLVQSGRFAYRYGFSSQSGENYRLMSDTTLSKEQLEQLADENGNKKQLTFDVTFDHKVAKFEIGKSIGSGRRLFKVNGEEGICFISEQNFNKTEVLNLADSRSENNEDISDELKRKLVVSLNEECAQLTSLTGGKGASLAQLKKLSTFNDNNNWKVPNAVVVTTSAYSLQTGSLKEEFTQKLRKLEEQVIKRENVETSCEQFRKWFAEQRLHEKVKEELKQKLELQFGVEEMTNSLFAVRSSACGEDSSEMSAAGQMTTFLGVSGLEKISKAVVSCWASQFAFVPIEYKRGYGQQLNSPMAVVVQKIVNCDAAGVIFTAAPTNGDERLMTVTSNFGLGESVVSAAADPDTFTLKVNINANSYAVPRRIDGIFEKKLGKKALVTRLKQNVSGQTENDDIDGTENEKTSENTETASLTDEDLIRLGNIALEVFKTFYT